MSIFGETEEVRFCVFSHFEGQLLYKGATASGARIVRKYTLQDHKKFIEEELIADENGRFRFESKWADLKVGALSEFRVRQRVYVYYNDQEFVIWNASKAFKDEFADFGGKPTNLSCEISTDRRRVELEISALVHTNCHWDIAEKFDYDKYFPDRGKNNE